VTVLDTSLFGEVKARVAQHCGWHPHEVKLVQNVTPLEMVHGQQDETPLWELLGSPSTTKGMSAEACDRSVTLTVIRHRFCSRGGPDVIHRYVAGLAAGVYTVSTQAPPLAVRRFPSETLQMLDVLIDAALRSAEHRAALVDGLCELSTLMTTCVDGADHAEGDLGISGNDDRDDDRDDNREVHHVVRHSPSTFRKQVMQICQGIFDGMMTATTLGPSPNCIDMMELLASLFVRRFMSMRILETMMEDLLVHAPKRLFEEVQRHAGGFCRILDEVTEQRYKERVASLRMLVTRDGRA
jgi:hypothetical protein